jgi:hypothetical protein
MLRPTHKWATQLKLNDHFNESRESQSKFSETVNREQARDNRRRAARRSARLLAHDDYGAPSVIAGDIECLHGNDVVAMNERDIIGGPHHGSGRDSGGSCGVYPGDRRYAGVVRGHALKRDGGRGSRQDGRGGIGDDKRRRRRIAG